MNRNDILRELELLPAWQLKAGFQASIDAPVKTPLVIEQASLKDVTQVPVTVEPAAVEPVLINPAAVIAKQAVTVLVFINTLKSENFYQSEAGILLDNMLKAIALKRGEDLVIAFDDEMQAFEPKLVLALGEAAAQKITNTSAPLSTLRGKVHQVNTTQIIASHDLAQLLSDPLLKREAWQDLKLLKLTLINLQST